MKILIESTPEMVTVNGQACRLWKGTTERGVKCDVFVPLLRVHKTEDFSQFEDELLAAQPPQEDLLPPVDGRLLS